MQKETKKQQGDMTSGNPFKLILTFAIPMILGNVIQLFYSMVDSAVVGRVVGSNALAAIGATQSVLTLIICLIIGVNMGVGILTSMNYGSGDESRVRRTSGTGIYLGLILWGVIAFLGFTISRPILTLLQTPEDIMNMAVSYLIINTATSIAPIFYNMTAITMRSLGDSKSSLYALIVSSLLNVVLDLIFVMAFDWGVAGAAWATAIAQFISCFFNIARIYKKHPILHLTKDDMKFRLPILKNILGVGLPMAAQSCVESIGLLGVQGVVNTCGTAAIAAYTAAGKIDQIALMPLGSLGLAISTYTGQNFGKGDGDRIHKGVRAGVIQSILVGVFLTIVVFSFRYFFPTLFVSEEETEVVQIAAEYLGIVSFFYVICGFMNIFLNVFRGMGKMRISTIGSFINPLVKMAAAFILNFTLGRTALWFAWPIGWICALAIPLYYYYARHGVEKALTEQEALAKSQKPL